MEKRTPSLYQSLSIIKQIAPECFETIIDVGAQKQTDFLADTFPESKHILFEPCSVYHDQLISYYTDKGIDHVVIQEPLSDKPRKMYLHHISQDGSDKITHTHLNFVADENMVHVKRIEPVNSTTLDEYYWNNMTPDMQYKFSIKIDVDGHEDAIINGGVDCVPAACFVIVEMSVGDSEQFANRILNLHKRGFRIFDICDPGYYYGQLSQVDVVFINNAVRRQIEKFCPWDISAGKVNWNKWQHKVPLHHAPYTVDFD